VARVRKQNERGEKREAFILPSFLDVRVTCLLVINAVGQNHEAN
jgi:hypothetical protein